MAIQLSDSYELHEQVSLRPEPFGALAYHFGNRRLTFLRSPQILALVESLGDYDTVGDALDAAGVEATRRPNFLSALSTLVDSEVICERS